MGERGAMLHRIYGREVNVRDQPINTRNFGRLIIRKIRKIIANRCRILRLNAPNSIPEVCIPFVS